MGLVDEIKVLIDKTISNGDLDSTEQLLEAFVKTGLFADCDILSYYAWFAYLKRQYAVCIYWIKLCRKKYGDNEITTKLAEVLNLEIGEVDLNDGLDKLYDVTAFERPLKILMYKGLIDIVDYTVDEFKNCYELLGHTVFTLDISASNTNVLKEYTEILDQGIDFVQVFNNNCYKVRLENSGQDYLEALGIPCYDYMFDHPMYFQSFNNEIPNNYIISCVDRNHNSYLDRFYNSKINNFFLPLGSAIGNNMDIPWDDRKIIALYVGSLKKNESMAEDEFSRHIIDYLIENTSSTTENAIELCYKKYVNDNPSEDEINSVINKYHYVDMNVNYHFRKKLVEVLVSAKIDVYVYGYGWNDVEFYNDPHFHYGGWISQNECLDLMKNSKFVLNSMPWFKDGIHDRVYNAMLAKSVCITDTSKYMMEHFTDDKDMVLYNLDSMQDIPKLIRYYMNHPEEAKKIAENGYANVVVNHTWQNRSIELLTHFMYERVE